MIHSLKQWSNCSFDFLPTLNYKCQPLVDLELPDWPWHTEQFRVHISKVVQERSIVVLAVSDFWRRKKIAHNKLKTSGFISGLPFFPLNNDSWQEICLKMHVMCRESTVGNLCVLNYSSSRLKGFSRLILSDFSFYFQWIH